MEQYCDGSHQHDSWRPRVKDGRLIFPTSEEAAYPWLLCARIVELILDADLKLGATQHATLSQQAQQVHFSMLSRYILGAVPRTTKLKPLVPEFASFQYIIAAVSNHDISCEILKLCPDGSKIVSRKLHEWGIFRTGQCYGGCKFFGIAERELNDIHPKLNVTRWEFSPNRCSSSSKPFQLGTQKILEGLWILLFTR